MDRDAWRKSDLCQNSDAVEVYDRVTLEFDRFLAEHGYVREGSSYRVERECTETVTFFAILGLRARCCRICGICRLFRHGSILRLLRHR